MFVVVVKSASGRISTGHLAPPPAVTRLPCADPRLYTCKATGVDPIKLTDLINGWSRMPSTISAPPWTKLTTPAGKPASSISLNSFTMVIGTRLDGFTTTVFPVVTAYEIGRAHV